MKRNNHRLMGDKLLDVARLLAMLSKEQSDRGFSATASKLSVAQLDVCTVAEALRHEAPPIATDPSDLRYVGSMINAIVGRVNKLENELAETDKWVGEVATTTTKNFDKASGYLTDADARLYKVERFIEDMCSGHPV